MWRISVLTVLDFYGVLSDNLAAIVTLITVYLTEMWLQCTVEPYIAAFSALAIASQAFAWAEFG